MEEKYILAVDQSTQGTKALLFNQTGKLIGRSDLPHRQIVNEKGWVSHDLMEIYQNTLLTVKNVLEKTGIDKNAVAGVGISNQRETSAAWDRITGEPVGHAVVWQCSRGEPICERVKQQGKAELIRKRTGINLSPYFPASKFAWLLENAEGAREKYNQGRLMFGTVDTWLVYMLTGKKSYKTDYSNASRTQLFNINTLRWDEEICRMFGLEAECLAEVCDSNANFGETDFDGYLNHPIPIHGVMGDSHGALFGQGCLTPGMMKATYGTGSSIMMNVGNKPVYSTSGAVTSLAWGINGEVSYVLEGNINYTGAVITWLQKEMHLIENASEVERLAEEASQEDKTYLVPAFTGLGAPYWDSNARAAIWGISRTTGRAEIAKAALECIAYQITDIVEIMRRDTGIDIQELRVDGGPTRNKYLMQFQSDMTGAKVEVPDVEELSGIGAAYAAGLALGIFDSGIFGKIKRTRYIPTMEQTVRNEKYAGWKHAVNILLTK